MRDFVATLYCNCRSLLPKLDELILINSVDKFDTIFLTETWLHSNITDRVVNIQNYSIFRHDRHKCKGGGVAIYVKNNVLFEELSDS